MSFAAIATTLILFKQCVVRMFLVHPPGWFGFSVFKCDVTEHLTNTCGPYPNITGHQQMSAHMDPITS